MHDPISLRLFVSHPLIQPSFEWLIYLFDINLPTQEITVSTDGQLTRNFDAFRKSANNFARWAMLHARPFLTVSPFAAVH